MGTITGEIREHLAGGLAAARAARRSGDWARCWELLEEAHVLSQPWAAWHVRAHQSMLLAGARAGDGREVWGQLVRLILAGPGSATGRYPVGNTGRARVSATRPMPIRDDLAQLLREAGR